MRKLKDVLMKKIALFAIALLVSLPGCRKDKTQQQQKKQQTEQRVDMFSSASSDYDYEDYEDEDEDDLRTLFDFDEESEEFVAQNENDLYNDLDMDYDMSDSQAITWIDAQTEDELKPLYFEFNKHVLNDTQKQAVAHDIEQVKQLLADAGTDVKAKVVVEGNTCQEGTPEYNLALSESRAKNVEDLLVDAGIDRDVIKIVGRGQENPLVEGKTRAERAPNRRVEIRVIYT